MAGSARKNNIADEQVVHASAAENPRPFGSKRNSKAEGARLGNQCPTVKLALALALPPRRARVLSNCSRVKARRPAPPLAPLVANLNQNQTKARPKGGTYRIGVDPVRLPPPGGDGWDPSEQPRQVWRAAPLSGLPARIEGNVGEGAAAEAPRQRSRGWGWGKTNPVTGLRASQHAESVNGPRGAGNSRQAAGRTAAWRSRSKKNRVHDCV
ncbi:hypothetical protein AXG93_2035s1050 [Marchantia polymorpha subsp. ruderalis]|uniref:Uncharacterized protein n=1 Tax=Marchantia polymorpha subsp. ruderalis TaxID=1480154 RepID=A0A176VP95_MARPO|nr:hypothetical protein AXG93_2035s1050 [Marchantia polymorpha subsp. ruderalis]